MLSKNPLKTYLPEEFPFEVIKDIHWRSQDSDQYSVLFYRVPKDQKNEELFFSRISSSNFGWLIVNRALPSLPKNSCVISEEKWPSLQKLLLDQLFPLPPLKFVAITGTNGKTTTADLVLQLGHLLGKKGLSIGTLGVREYHRTLLDFGLTSPSFIDLRKFIHQYGQDKDFCVMEASSHALLQDRLHGLEFDSAGWLSFSQDHLDYHHSMEAYFDAKSMIYQQLKPTAFLFTPKEQRRLFEKLLKVSEKTKEAPPIEEELPLFFRTSFNRNNLEVAQAIVEDLFKIKVSLDYARLSPPDGRFYIRPYKSNYIIVDFAHTPDALENICKGIKETFPGYRLKVLFGCGGDRDRTKRPLMAKVVSEYADEIYVTSDNPRTEDPEQIIRDIIMGINKSEYKAITERPVAVKQAFAELTEKEVLLLAGKGHEDYILINGVKHPYSDIREVDEFIARTKA